MKDIREEDLTNTLFENEKISTICLTGGEGFAILLTWRAKIIFVIVYV